MSGDKDFERRLELIERGVRDIEAAPDAGLRATAQQLVQSILELHAMSLERLLDIVLASSDTGQAIIARLGQDPLVGKLLLLHSLHPLPLETRVLGALQDLRPTLEARHAVVELLGIEGGTVRLRIVGGAELRSAVERAILEAAPDTTALDVEGTADDAAVVGFVSLESLRGVDSTRPSSRTIVPA
jgi:hypothetical protein